MCDQNHRAGYYAGVLFRVRNVNMRPGCLPTRFVVVSEQHATLDLRQQAVKSWSYRNVFADMYFRCVHNTLAGQKRYGTRKCGRSTGWAKIERKNLKNSEELSERLKCSCWVHACTPFSKRESAGRRSQRAVAVKACYKKSDWRSQGIPTPLRSGTSRSIPRTHAKERTPSYRYYFPNLIF